MDLPGVAWSGEEAVEEGGYERSLGLCRAHRASELAWFSKLAA